MRIIAGSRKGHTLTAPAGRNTRPTLDRVKEALFGILQLDIPGAVVLDLFAGSGNLGLEALSRGAAAAVFCEHDRRSAAVVRGNIQALRFEAQSVVYAADYATAIARAAEEGRRFDVVFLDPPYASGLAEAAMRLLNERDVLAADGIIAVEHAPDAPPIFPAGYTVDTRRYGEVAVSVLRREREAEEEEHV